MSLLRKLRTLVGALVHAPFAPKPDRADLDQPSKPTAAASPADGAGSAGLAAGEPGVADTDRVADLLARRKGTE